MLFPRIDFRYCGSASEYARVLCPQVLGRWCKDASEISVFVFPQLCFRNVKYVSVYPFM